MNLYNYIGNLYSKNKKYSNDESDILEYPISLYKYNIPIKLLNQFIGNKK